MQVLFRAALLLLLLSASAAEDCEMPEKMQPQQLNKITESPWVQVEAFAYYPEGKELLRLTSSSLLEVTMRSDNKTFLLVERNVVDGKCLIYRLNMTVPDPEKSNHTMEVLEPGTEEYNGVVTVYYDQGRADFYQSCPDCLLIIYNAKFEGTLGRMLLFYRREGKHQDADDLKAAAVVHKKMAECLKFDVSTWFTYDGAAEFCVDKKKEA